LFFLAEIQNARCFYNSELAGGGCVWLVLLRSNRYRSHNFFEEVRHDRQHPDFEVIDPQGQTLAPKEQVAKFEEARPEGN